MKEKRYSGNELRRVLAGMVTDCTVCSRIAGQWRDGGLFDAPWANLVGQWCVKYVREYGQAPAGQIQPIFEQWAQSTQAADATVKSVERFLGDLSDEHAQRDGAPSSDHLLDMAGRLFNKVRMKAAMELVQDDLDQNRVDEAHGRLATLTRVELGVGAMTKPAEDFSVWRQAFDPDRRRQLIHYPGKLDRFIGSAMVTESLIAFMGPDKSGKSMWLLDLGFRALRGRLRLAYFECGDNGRDEVYTRMGERTARHPREAMRIRVPVSMGGKGEIEYKIKEFDEGLTPGRGFKAVGKLCRGRDCFRLSCHANTSINVGGIDAVLRDWQREGWTPDVTVIDYADILASPSGVRETLDQIDETWKALRRLSQEHHCLVATATQSSALAYSGKDRVLTKKHFGGRKTKLAHVNGMIGLNVTPEDKKRGITRVNWIVKRTGRYNERAWEPTAGCLDIANPAVRGRPV